MQIAADCEKINKGCVNDEKKAISLAVNKIRDKIFVNEMKVIPVQDGCDIEKKRKNCMKVSRDWRTIAWWQGSIP